LQVKILGCSGGIGAGLKTTSMLVDGDILIDTGTGVGDLNLAEMFAVRHVFLTHSHLDHSGGLPLIVDTLFEKLLGDPLTVYGREETLDAVRKHIFNWEIWPDFSQLPVETRPVMKYMPMEIGASQEIAGRRFTSVEVNHAVPAVGYIIESEGKTFCFTGDTMTNDTLWPVLNALPSLDVLVIEVAFADRNEKVAKLAGHYTPSTLAADMAKLEHDPDVYITHLKPGEEDKIYAEVEAALPQRRLHRLENGQIIEI
jgi:ribonuclease BN (tRNA processing enzyme)